MDSELNATFVKARMAEMLGYSPEEMLGRPIQCFMFEEHRTGRRERMDRRKQGQRDSYAHRFRHKHGHEVWTLVSATPIIGAQGEFLGSFGMLTDMTDRKKMEEAPRKSETVLNNIIEQSPFSMWISDAQGTLQRINPACKKWTRLTDGEVVGKYNVLSDEAVEAQGLMPLVRSVFEEGRTVNFELVWDSSLLKHIDRAETTKLTLDVTMFPVKDQDDTITNAVCKHIDITDRQDAQKALRRSEAKYRSLFDNAVLGIFQSTPEGTFTEMNPAFALVFGFDSPDEMKRAITNIKMQLYVRPEDRDTFNHRLATDGIVQNFETEIYRRDGTTRWISINAKAFLDQRGRVLYHDGTIEDITDRKRAEDQIRNLNTELEQRVRERTALLEDAAISPVKDPSGRILNFVAVKRDVTDHLKPTEQLSQAEKNGSRGYPRWRRGP